MGRDPPLPTHTPTFPPKVLTNTSADSGHAYGLGVAVLAVELHNLEFLGVGDVIATNKRQWHVEHPANHNEQVRYAPVLVYM